jgi:sensitive to high expression protein 9
MPPPPSEEQISIQGEQPALTRSEEQPSTPSDIQDEAIAVPPHPTADAEPGRLHSSGREDNADSKRAPTEETLAEEKIARVAAEDLPSHREEQRWDFSKRISEFMDELLPKLAVVTQKVNTYTGTDYTSIAALKQEIKDQGTASSNFA